MGLVALYDKNYGLYQWKQEAFDYNLLRLQPWLEQIYSSKDDLAFYDVCVRYVASLHDFHDEFILPSIYEATLPLTADIYDGKVLVDFVSDPATYPISIGDQIVSVDGVSATTWISLLAPYSVNGEGNPVSRDRLAVATMLTAIKAGIPMPATSSRGKSQRSLSKAPTAPQPIRFHGPPSGCRCLVKVRFLIRVPRLLASLAKHAISSGGP